MEQPDKVQVAVIRAGNRRGAVAQALSLIAGPLAEMITPSPVIIPHLSTSSMPGASTHPDVISATVDALLAAGAETIEIAAASPRPDGPADCYFDRLGYRGELWGRPVSFAELPPGGGRSDTSFIVSLAVARGTADLSLRPTLRIVDGFPATKRSGPYPKRWSRSGTVIAGLDAAAVDAVTARLLGYDQRRGDARRVSDSPVPGVSDPDRIEIIGDRPLRLHRVSGQALRMHWRPRRQWALKSRVRSG
jgi:uncharacterized protein (DUF362 family)